MKWHEWLVLGMSSFHVTVSVIHIFVTMTIEARTRRSAAHIEQIAERLEERETKNG